MQKDGVNDVKLNVHVTEDELQRRREGLRVSQPAEHPYLIGWGSQEIRSRVGRTRNIGRSMLSKATHKSSKGMEDKVCTQKIAAAEMLSSADTLGGNSLSLFLGINKRTHYQEKQLREGKVCLGR